MAKSKRSGKAHAGGYTKYANSKAETVNRIRKLKALLKKQPNNTQISIALNNVSHRRNPPKTKMWNPTTIRLATIMKQFTGKFSRDIFSSDPEVSSAAYKVRNNNKFMNYKQPAVKGSMFSIKERAVWK